MLPTTATQSALSPQVRMAGVNVSEEVQAMLKRLDQRGSSSSIFAVLKLDDGGQLLLEHEGTAGNGLAQFTAVLPQDDARYGLFKTQFQTRGGARTKLLLVLWTPGQANRVQRFAYAMCQKSVKAALNVVDCSLQVGRDCGGGGSGERGRPIGDLVKKRKSGFVQTHRGMYKCSMESCSEKRQTEIRTPPGGEQEHDTLRETKKEGKEIREREKKGNEGWGGG